LVALVRGVVMPGAPDEDAVALADRVLDQPELAALTNPRVSATDRGAHLLTLPPQQRHHPRTPSRPAAHLPSSLQCASSPLRVPAAPEDRFERGTYWPESTSGGCPWVQLPGS
jgi:hypothetical protein